MSVEITGTLKKIKETGAITLGRRVTSIPFSFLDQTQAHPVGYSIDLGLAVVDALKKELDLPDIKVNYAVVKPSTRIAMVKDGTVDLECGSTSNNLERKHQVAFSYANFEIKTRILAKSGGDIKDFADLVGKNVATVASTTSERIIKAMNVDKQMKMNVRAHADNEEAFNFLEVGRAAALVLDDAQLAGLLSVARKPDNWAITGTEQSTEVYSLMFRKDEEQFRNSSTKLFPNSSSLVKPINRTTSGLNNLSHLDHTISIGL